MKLIYQYMAILFIFSSIIFIHHKSRFDSILRLVVDEDDSVKSGLKGLMMIARLTNH